MFLEVHLPLERYKLLLPEETEIVKVTLTWYPALRKQGRPDSRKQRNSKKT